MAKKISAKFGEKSPHLATLLSLIQLLFTYHFVNLQRFLHFSREEVISFKKKSYFFTFLKNDSCLFTFFEKKSGHGTHALGRGEVKLHVFWATLYNSTLGMGMAFRV